MTFLHSENERLIVLSHGVRRVLIARNASAVLPNRLRHSDSVAAALRGGVVLVEQTWRQLRDDDDGVFERHHAAVRRLDGEHVELRSSVAAGSDSCEVLAADDVSAVICC